MRNVWLLLALGLPAVGQAQAPRVEVVAREADRRVDVTVDGQPFTSYVWPTTLKKPTLYPIRAASGALVTRGWPLEPRPGERVDHPHQVGLWFDHGDVNGLDFWNNSDAIPPARAAKMGTILHRAVRRTESGSAEGTLDITAEWVDYAGTPLLREDTRFVFRAADGLRSIDRITTLTALARPVTFVDNKEGLVGMRVARGLEQPKNPGFPTYWHARGYGLFAANPLGQKAFTNGKESLNFGLAPQEAATFRYRILILSGAATPEQIET